MGDTDVSKSCLGRLKKHILAFATGGDCVRVLPLAAGRGKGSSPSHAVTMTRAPRPAKYRASAKRVRVQFGIMLKAARIEAGLSQSDFPGHDQSFISKVERGTAGLKIETMAKIAAVVGRDLDDMLAEIGKALSTDKS